MSEFSTIEVQSLEDVITVTDTQNIISVNTGEICFTIEDTSEIIQVELVDETTTITVLAPDEVLEIISVNETIDCEITEEVLDFTSNEPTVISVTEITNNITAPATEILTKNTGENIDAHLIVVAVDDIIFKADNSIPSHINIVLGLSITAATTGQGINIVTSGEIIEPSWNWTPNKAIFLSAGGNLTQSITLSGFLLNVGFAISPTKMWLDVKIPLIIN